MKNIGPFVGFGITAFSEAHKDEEDKWRIVDNNMVFGVNKDLKFNTRINFAPNPFFG